MYSDKKLQNNTTIKTSLENLTGCRSDGQRKHTKILLQLLKAHKRNKIIT